MTVTEAAEPSDEGAEAGTAEPTSTLERTHHSYRLVRSLPVTFFVCRRSMTSPNASWQEPTNDATTAPHTPSRPSLAAR